MAGGEGGGGWEEAGRVGGEGDICNGVNNKNKVNKKNYQRNRRERDIHIQGSLLHLKKKKSKTD